LHGRWCWGRRQMMPCLYVFTASALMELPEKSTTTGSGNLVFART
jgi:hypothetical protein